MARYVVLSFEDNEEAERFVDAAKLYVADEQTNMSRVEPTVVGLYAQPTLFCEGCTMGKRVRAWTRGKKYGWWICAKCGKPSNANLTDEKLMRHVISAGKNFLHQRIIPQATNLLDPAAEPASVHDEGWGGYSHGS